MNARHSSVGAGATRRATLRGFGLHTGAPAHVRFEAASGPVTFGAGGAERAGGDHAGASVPIEALRVVATDRATTIAALDDDGRELFRVGTVEHVLGALAGLGLYRGVRVVVAGPELPLLDGCAAEFCEALDSLGVAPTPPPLRVVREASLQLDESRYDFTPADGIDVSVQVDFGDPRLLHDARWRADADDFRSRIAPARTFALARDMGELLARGLARHVEPASCVLIAPDAVHAAGRPFQADEPARHKLLDLLGDWYLAGGPAVGRILAVRPGHSRNVEAFARARALGVVAPA